MLKEYRLYYTMEGEKEREFLPRSSSIEGVQKEAKKLTKREGVSKVRWVELRDGEEYDTRIVKGSTRLQRLAMEVQDIASNLRFEGKMGKEEKVADAIDMEDYTSAGDVLGEYLAQIGRKAFGRRAVIETGAGMVMLEIEVYDENRPNDHDVYQVKLEFGGNGALGVDVVYVGGDLQGRRGRVLTLGFREALSMASEELHDKLKEALTGRIYATQPDSPALEEYPR